MAVSMTTPQSPAALGGDGPSVTAGLLGLADPGLDDLKSAAVPLSSRVLNQNKKPKMTHGLFFDDDRGLKKVLTSFPRIRFGGKGREFDDLKLLIRHYERWIRDLYPCDDNFEDLVWKTRNLLQEKEKADDGVVSDPKERLHLLRFEYKTSGGVGLAGERAKAEAAATKQRKNAEIALELSKRKETNQSDLDSETLWRIEEKRAKALELKRKRQADAAAANPLGPASGPSQTSQTQSDVFGFGGDLDGSQSPATQRPGAAAPGKTSSQSQQSQDDVFGFGGAMSQTSSGTKSVARGRPPSQGSQRSMFSEEDVFGFGGGFDGSQASSIRSQASAKSQTGAAPAAAGPAAHGGQVAMGMPQSGVDMAAQPVLGPSQRVLPEELLRKIEANRQKALEVQRRKREAEEASQGPQEPPDDLDVETLLKIEENRAKAMELRKKRQERRASQSQSQSSQSQSEVFGHGGALSQSQASGLTQQSQLSQIARARNASQSQGSQQSQLSQIARARNMSQSQGSRGSQVDALASPASQISQDPAASAAGNAASSQAAQAHGWTATQDEAFFASQLPTPTRRGRRAATTDTSGDMDQDVFGFSFDDFDAFMDKPQATALEPGSVGESGTSSLAGGDAQQTQPEAASDVAMSQPDVFGFGCDFDTSQAGPVADSMVQPTPPTQPVVNPGSSQVGHTATATAFAETSQATQLSAMPPPSALPASKLHRAEVAVDTAGRAPAPTPALQTAGQASSMLPPSSAPDEVASMSQPDIFGFGFDMDASQAEPTSTTSLPSAALDADISSPDAAGTVTLAMETAPADVPEPALPGLTAPEAAAPAATAAAATAPGSLMVASQPDVFNFGFGMDASQAAPTSMASSSQPGTNAAAASQQHADTEGPAVSQRDIFTFDCDFDASQAGDASQQGSRESRAATDAVRDDGD